MKVTVLSRSGREIVKGLEVSDDALVEELQQAFFSYNKKWYPARQRFTLPAPANDRRPTILEGGKKLSEYSLGNDGTAVVVFKDLGPQVGYKTVFFWEYFGPLVIYPLFYFFPAVFYPWAPKGREVTHHAQTVALFYWSFHYSKRILETFFIHSFSHATMPIFNLFRNCGYYWFFGAFIAYFVNHPLYTPVPLWLAHGALTASMLCQLANFYCHVILRSLRPATGKGGYQIPRGFLFDYITCANYFTEIWGWIGFNVATQTVAGYLFLFAGFYQMSMWAVAKHKRLRKLFDGKDGRPKYPRRWVMFPPFF